MTRDVIPPRPAGPVRHPASASAGMSGSATSPNNNVFCNRAFYAHDSDEEASFTDNEKSSWKHDDFMMIIFVEAENMKINMVALHDSHHHPHKVQLFGMKLSAYLNIFLTSFFYLLLQKLISSNYERQ